MTLTIEIRPDIQAKLQRSAEQRGLPMQEYIQQLIETAPPVEDDALSASALPLRPFGLCAGKFTVPDDFNAPLPDDILAEFGGK